MNVAFKTGVERVEVTSSPMLEEATAGVKVSGKMFGLLTRIYSRPVEAGVREIVNNAIDANIEAGRPDAPVIIRIPKKWDTTFAVRDHGTSMSHQFMMTRYMRLGDSTKELDAQQTGFWGIGSKSPLALVDQYYVTCFQGGQMRVYSITRKTFDEKDGSYDTIPVIGLVMEAETSEPDGTEVSWAVEEANKAQLYNAVTLTVAGASGKANIVVERDGGVTTDYDFKAKPWMAGDTWGVYPSHEFLNSFGHNRSMVRVGRILYNLDINAVLGGAPVTSRNEVIRRVFGSDTIIEVPMPAVRIAPSREELEYTPTTVRVIYDELNRILDSVVKAAQDEVSQQTNVFDAITTLKKHITDSRMNSFMVGSVTWNGVVLDLQGVEIPEEFVNERSAFNFAYRMTSGFSLNGGQKLSLVSSHQRDRSANQHYIATNGRKVRVFVTNYKDKETRFFNQRVVAYLNDQGLDLDTQVLWLRRDAAYSAQFDAAVAKMGLPKDWFVEVKDLPAYTPPATVPAAPKAKRPKGMEIARVFSHVGGKLRAENIDVNAVVDGVYVVMTDAVERRQFIGADGKPYSSGWNTNDYDAAHKLADIVSKHLGIGKLYFIRESVVKKSIDGKPNWTIVWDKMKAGLDKFRKTQADLDGENDHQIANSSEIIRLLSEKSSIFGRFPQAATLVSIARATKKPTYTSFTAYQELTNYVGDGNASSLKPSAQTPLTVALDAIRQRWPLLADYAEIWSGTNAYGAYASLRDKTAKLAAHYMEKN